MKLKKKIIKIADIKTISQRHAVYGEIITTKDEYSPCFVLHSYFEPRLIEKYGIDSDELLKHGTGYVDALTSYGQIIRLQYYEYAIIVYSKRIADRFKNKFLQLNTEFSYNLYEYLQPDNKNIEI